MKKFLPQNSSNVFKILIATLSLSVILAVISLVYPRFLETKSASLAIFTQNDWSGGGNPGIVTDQLSGWIQFENSSPSLDYSSGLKIGHGINKWEQYGVPIIADENYQYDLRIKPDNQGNAVLGWQSNNSASGTDDNMIFQKIDSDGNELWGSDGIILSMASDDWKMETDLSGNTYVFGKNGSTGYIQKINTNGFSQWGSGVLSAGSNFSSEPIDLIPDDLGGLIIVYTENIGGAIAAKKIDNSGNVSLEKIVSASGVNPKNRPKIVSDGNNGAIVSWRYDDSSSSKIYAQRIDNNLNDMWSSEIAVSSSSSNASNNFQIVSNGSGGAIMVWEDYRNGSDADIYAQSIDSDGNIIGNSNDILVCDASGEQELDQSGDYLYGKGGIAPDGSGGAYISWVDERNGTYKNALYIQRINSSGNIIGTPNGVMVVPFDNDAYWPYISSDKSSGAFLVWSNHSANYGAYAQRFDSNLNPIWNNGVDYSGISIYVDGLLPMIEAISPGVGIEIWEDWRDSSTATDVYAQKVSDDGYFNSGELVSSIIDIGKQTIWDTFDWSATIPANTSVEFQTRTAADDFFTNQALTGTFSASSEDPYPFPAYNAGDGDRDASNWRSEDNGMPISPSNPQWLAVDFGAPTKVSRIDLFHDPKQYPTDFEIQICIDNNNCDENIDSDWNTIYQVDNYIYTDGIFSTSFDQVETSKVRIYITAQIDEGVIEQVSIDELEVYSDILSDWSTPITSSGSTITSPVGQYIQYKINFRSDGSDTPILDSITISELISDLDDDGVPDGSDNCKYTANAGQEDNDSLNNDVLIVYDNDASIEDGTNGDDGNDGPYYKTILDDYGYNTTVWDESSDSEPTLIDLQSFDAVVWACGDYYSNCPEETEADNVLIPYIDQGGKLIVSGTWILYDWSGDTFGTEVLHGDSYRDYSDEIYDIMVANANHPIAKGFTQNQTFNVGESPTGANYAYIDIYTELLTDNYDDTTNLPEVVFQSGPNSIPDNSYLTTAYEDSISGAKVVYSNLPMYSWPIRERIMLIRNVMDWFGLGADNIGDACDICPDDASNSCVQGSGTSLVTSYGGGVVSTNDDNVSIDIPQDALSENEVITIEEAGSNFAITDLSANAIISYEISPSGLNFNSPIEITIYVPMGSISNVGDLKIYYSSDDGNTWVDHNNIIDRGDDGINYYVTFTTDHFSNYAVGYPATGSSVGPPSYTAPIKEEVSEELPEEIDHLQPVVCPSTLAEVQNFPIPPFNSGWGVGYPSGRVNWALEHRKAVYNLYVNLLRRNPCADEVNWWLQYSDDINLIRYLFLTSEEYQLKYK